VPEVLSDNPSLQEILWYFSRYTDQKPHLTLRENPHFYVELPTSPEEYGDSLRIDPTEDFQHANKFYVLIDKPDLVHISTDRISQYFGNFWCPKNAIIFKGSGVLFLYFPVFLRVFQTSVGGSGGKPSSRHRSQAHTVGSVSRSRFPPFQELPGIVVDYSQLSQRGVQGLAGNVRLAIYQCTVQLISAFAFVLGEWHPIIRYVVTLSHIKLCLLTST
jgi:hypothetical protein